MYLDFYNLREQPFGVTPDPRYLYFSPAHREALASLFYGIETGRGFLSLIAQTVERIYPQRFPVSNPVRFPRTTSLFAGRSGTGQPGTRRRANAFGVERFSVP